MEKQTEPHVLFSSEAQKVLFLDVYERREIEACGVLLGSVDDQGNWHIEEVCPLRNIFDSPVYFEFAPEDLLMVELEQPGRVIGVYHSHPTGLARASSTDRENMKRVNEEQQIPWVWCIISGPFSEPFEQGQEGDIAGPAMIAYYHYEDGLRRVPIQFEETVKIASHDEG